MKRFCKVVSIVLAMCMMINAAMAESASWYIRFAPGAPSSVNHTSHRVNIITTKDYTIHCTASSVPSGTYSPYVKVSSASWSSGTTSFSHTGNYGFSFYTMPTNLRVSIDFNQVNPNASGCSFSGTIDNRT